MARFNTDGPLDSTFGTGGTLRFDRTRCTERAEGVAVLADGTILASEPR